jgi:hypothetical protein
MPSLPSDIWCIVTCMLASESDSTAISRLNASCSEIHHATLPTLYQTVCFKSLEKLKHAVTAESKEIWKHVK